MKILYCHRCNQPYAKFCDAPHDHRQTMCVFYNELADVRICACGETIHKGCHKSGRCSDVPREAQPVFPGFG